MRALIPLFLLVGCAADSAGPTLAERDGGLASAPIITGCDYEQRFVDADYAHEQLSAPDALGILEVVQLGLLRWDATGAQTVLQLSVSEVGDLREIRALDAACPDSLLLDGTVSLTTEDGRLDEQFDATFRQDQVGVLHLERWVAMDQLSGSWDPRELDAEVHTAADLEIVASLATDTSSGQLALYAQRDDGGVDGWDVARWPAAP